MTDVARSARRFLGAVLLLAGWLVACEQPDPELMPDELLQTELGLTPEDRVHTVRLATGVGERATPAAVTIDPGDFVQFVSDDGFAHEVAFALDSLSGLARAFLERTGQATSPPLIERGARFVVSFSGAPPGRYLYLLAGNRDAGRGEVVVRSDPR